MELRVLEYFLALAQEGSVSAAASALHVSQPTLSRQLIDLERELGVTLFERTRRGVVLTEDGMLLRRRAAEIVDLARITRQEVLLGHDAVAGEIRIGCAETQAMDVLARVMRDVRDEHPQVTFRIEDAIAEDVVERINRGLLDFGLLLRLRDGWGLDAVRLPTSERAVVVMPKGDPLATKQLVTMDDIAQRPLIVPTSFRESGMLAGELPVEEGGRLHVVAQFDMPYNASRMVRAGLGVMVGLDGLAGVGGDTGLVVRPLDVRLDMPAYLVWKPHQRRTRACEAFLNVARDAYGAQE